MDVYAFMFQMVSEVPERPKNSHHKVGNGFALHSPSMLLSPWGVMIVYYHAAYFFRSYSICIRPSAGLKPPGHIVL